MEAASARPLLVAGFSQDPLRDFSDIAQGYLAEGPGAERGLAGSREEIYVEIFLEKEVIGGWTCIATCHSPR